MDDLMLAPGFTAADPQRILEMGPVYERENVKQKPYQQAEGVTTYTVNDHYQVTADPAAMTWNDNGYLTGRGADDFAWTALGQLAQADLDGGDTLDYTYDAFGRRVKTVNGSQVNRFLYHGWHMVGEYDDVADAWLWQEAPWNGGERMLEHVALDAADVDDDTNTDEYRQYAVHEDFQDTVWGLSGTNTAIAERYNYTDPYGQSDSEDGAASALGDFATQVVHRKRMHGGFVEANLRSYDYRNRWLQSECGVWYSQDPLAELHNLYQAFSADPVRLSDQWGNQTISTIAECFGQLDPCPAASWVSGFCYSGEMSTIRDSGRGGALLVNMIYGRGPKPRVSCPCGTCPTNSTGGVIGGETGYNERTETIVITIYYRERSGGLIGELVTLLSGGIIPPPPGLQDDCCICWPGGTAQAVLHELIHGACNKAHGAMSEKCSHGPGGHSSHEYNEAADAMRDCMTSGEPDSPACRSASGKLDKLLVN